VWTGPLPATEQQSPTYYELPMLKEPVWKWYVPAYFYVGGLSGACAALGASAELLGGPRMARLARQCRLIAATGAAASAVLLVADLGRPSRFLNMLRVFRPSSPMNLGTWFLSSFGACAGLAALPEVWALPAPVRRLAARAGIGAGLIGLPMTGYTGVLLANTAVPLWQGARRSLPILFSSSGAATAASILEILGDSDEGASVTFRFGLIAKATELAMTLLLEREVSVVPRVARPLRTGFSGTLWRAAQVAGAASLILSVVGRKRTSTRRVAGVVGAAAALGLRFALFHGGKRSARDPRASFEQQREGR
jgi:formate-dependent nitrite reductase membrane component NrfD